MSGMVLYFFRRFDGDTLEITCKYKKTEGEQETDPKRQTDRQRDGERKPYGDRQTVGERRH